MSSFVSLDSSHDPVCDSMQNPLRDVPLRHALRRDLHTAVQVVFEVLLELSGDVCVDHCHIELEVASRGQAVPVERTDGGVQAVDHYHLGMKRRRVKLENLHAATQQTGVDVLTSPTSHGDVGLA